MVKIKGWEKLKDEKYFMVWTNGKSRVEFSKVGPNLSNAGKYRVKFIKNFYQGIGYTKHYNHKEDALKEAYNYMRSHKNG